VIDNISIIALHGLGARSPHTWLAWKDGVNPESGSVNWLKDSNMLPSAIPSARILMYNWNANYAENASQDRLSGHAHTLLDRLRLEREKTVCRQQKLLSASWKLMCEQKKSGCPIIFIASCFGGLLLAKVSLEYF
jgi:hypothetical protein